MKFHNPPQADRLMKCIKCNHNFQGTVCSGCSYDYLTYLGKLASLARHCFEFCRIAQLSIELLDDRQSADMAISIAERKAKGFKDYCDIAETYIALDNQARAKEMLMRAENSLTSFNEYCSLPGLYVSLANDVRDAGEVLARMALAAQEVNDYCLLAGIYIDVLHDRDNADKILKKAIEQASKYDEFYSITRAYINLLKDRECAVKTMQSALGQAKYGGELQAIAELCTDISLISNNKKRLKDKDKEKRILQHEFSISEIDPELFHNKSSLVKALSRATKKCQDKSEYLELAEAYVVLLDDRETARKLLEQAEKAATDRWFKYCWLASSYIKLLNDQNKVKELLSKATESAIHSHDYREIADVYVALLNDYDSAREVLNNSKE